MKRSTSPHRHRGWPTQAPRRSGLLRALLGASAAGVVATAIGGGCGAPFDEPSDVSELRILAVVADKPYAAPGDEVKLDMTYHDGLGASDPDAGERPVQITWIGGCFNPTGDQYFGCFESLRKAFEGVTGPDDLPEGLFGFGPSFTLKLPADLVSSRPVPDTGPQYGMAIVFFAACAGQLRPLTGDEGTGRAGSFPLGCFDTATGKRLDSDSFVPGYTQIYAFADGRTNANPPVAAITMDGTTLAENPDKDPEVPPCKLTDEERRAQGCDAKKPEDECKTFVFDVAMKPGFAETDPDAALQDGKKLTEAVWVDYFADGGDFDSSIKLVNDPQAGEIDDHSSRWVPPAEPGRVNLWAVVHDARGGTTVVERSILVK